MPEITITGEMTLFDVTEAYPESTPTGTVFLSAFTTKVAVYALARGFVGAEPLIYIDGVRVYNQPISVGGASRMAISPLQ